MSSPNSYQPGAGQSNYTGSPQYSQQYPQQDGKPQDPRTEFLNYRFSPEELRVIAECESEAFYYRSLPFGLGLGSAAFLGVTNGVLKANPKFGPWPKVIGFTLIGYIAGRLSYTRKCQEKMMALPNSRFGEMLRRNLQRKSGNWSDVGSLNDAGAATALSLAPFQASVDSYSDEFSQPNALNLDTNRPHYSSLDDTFTPTKEGSNDLNEVLAIPQRKNTVTYDELRQKNRDDYAKAHFGPNYNQNNSPPPSTVGPYNPPADPGQQSPGPFLAGQPSENRRFRNRDDEPIAGQRTGPKNRYGDAWSE